MKEVFLPSRGPAPSAEPGTVTPRALPLYYPMIVIGLVLYGSLIPLDFDPSVFGLGGGLGLSGLGWPVPSLEDLLTNLLVYVPLGMSLVACVRGSARRKLAFVPLALLAGAAVSLSAEVLQAGLAQRHASWFDVIFNIVGTAGGAVAVVAFSPLTPRVIDRLRHSLTSTPWMTATSCLTLGIIFYNLMPFDLVTTTAELHDSFREAKWTLATPRGASSEGRPFGALVAALGGAAWFAALGFFSAKARREAAVPRSVALVRAAMFGGLLAASVEFLQLFTKSHVFDSATLGLRGIAAVFGAWLAISMSDLPSLFPLRSGRGGRWSLFVLAALGLFQIALVLIRPLDAQVAFPHAFDLSAVRWLPCESLWQRPMSRASSVVVLAMITYGAFAITAAFFLRQLSVRRAWLMAAGLTAALAIAGEALQVMSQVGTPDATEPVLALGAVLVAWRLEATVRSLVGVRV